MVALGAGSVVTHRAGPATLFQCDDQFYMMRFDITQPISHQSKVPLDFAHPKFGADEAQEHDAERDAKSCDQHQAGR
jgi:hypothetical protein